MKIKLIFYKINPHRFTPFVRFVNRCICFFTSSKYWHVSIAFDSTKYESGHPYGVLKDLAYEQQSEYIDIRYLEVSKGQADEMIRYADECLKKNIRYNHYKLLILSFIHPTRFIWNRIKWVPFQNNYFGMVCSVFVREILLAGKCDILPGLYKEITAPGDLAKSSYLKSGE